MLDSHGEQNCGCGCDRRGFLASVGLALGGVAAGLSNAATERNAFTATAVKQGATVRVVFLYPPSKTFSEDQNGWWSWPGNQFDAEARQTQYTAALQKMEKKLGMSIVTDDKSVAAADVQQVIREIETKKPDGLLLVMFYNNSLKDADQLLQTADKLGIPVVFYIGLGVKHGSVKTYRRPGVYLIQSLDNFEAIEQGLRMINTKKLMAQSKLLSITEAPAPREGTESFLGTKVRVIPFARYVEEFKRIAVGEETRKFIRRFTGGAKEIRGVTKDALENAARAHFALKRLLADENADGVAMNCLRRGMLKPCVSFSALNSELIPAACENDLNATYTQILGQRLVGRPGFQHNPCYETERNHYYASHCTCATKLHGPDSRELPYLLRRFAHTNEGSCAIQVFWKEGDPVTMVRYYPGVAAEKKPPALDVYAGRVVKSLPMPPAAGCTTNVEIEITDREDAGMVSGHHNLLFCGDFARQFRVFAQLYKMQLADTSFKGTWPV